MPVLPQPSPPPLEKALRGLHFATTQLLLHLSQCPQQLPANSLDKAKSPHPLAGQGKDREEPPRVHSLQSQLPPRHRDLRDF